MKKKLLTVVQIFIFSQLIFSYECFKTEYSGTETVFKNLSNFEQNYANVLKKGREEFHPKKGWNKKAEIRICS